MVPMDDDDLEMQLLLSGPANEADMYELLGGTFGSTNILRNVDDESAPVQEILVPATGIEDDFVQPSMLGCLLAPWTRRRRGSRMRNKSWNVVVGRLFGSQYPCTSIVEKHRRRKNNDHWTEDEVKELVDGVSKEGIGKWSKVKGEYFSTSIRTPAHLKDKWRNLVKACKDKNNSKRKVNVHKATELIVRRFKHRILAIEAKRVFVGKRIESSGSAKKRA